MEILHLLLETLYSQQDRGNRLRPSEGTKENQLQHQQPQRTMSTAALSEEASLTLRPSTPSLPL